MITLHGAGASRWIRPTWTLRELGVPFEEHKVKMKEGGHLERPAYPAHLFP